MTAHSKILAPDWPRLMRRRTAALYCDMTEAEFEREVSSGRFPQNLPKIPCSGSDSLSVLGKPLPTPSVSGRHKENLKRAPVAA